MAFEEFTDRQLKIVSDSLYFANNRLGKSLLKRGEYGEEAAEMQRNMNVELKRRSSPSEE